MDATIFLTKRVDQTKQAISVFFVDKIRFSHVRPPVVYPSGDVIMITVGVLTINEVQV